MKKASSLLLVLALCLSLFGCGGNHNDTDPTGETTDVATSLKITNEMQKEIKEEIESATFQTTLTVWIRLQFEGYEFTDVEITKYKLVDQYTYVAYGVLYTEDNYGGKCKDNIDFVFAAEEDPSDPRGYKFTWDIELH